MIAWLKGRCAVLLSILAIAVFLPRPSSSGADEHATPLQERLEALLSPEESARKKARKRLKRLSSEERQSVAPPLVELLPGPDYKRADAAVEALEALGADAVPALSKALGDEQPNIRREAALVVGRLGPAGEAAVPVLIGLLDDPSGSVSIPAAGALGSIGPGAFPALPHLIRRIAASEGRLRQDIINAIARINPAALKAFNAELEKRGLQSTIQTVKGGTRCGTLPDFYEAGTKRSGLDDFVLDIGFQVTALVPCALVELVPRRGKSSPERPVDPEVLRAAAEAAETISGLTAH